VIAADKYYGIETLPNLAPNDEARQYSGDLTDCGWHEDQWGLSRSVELDNQDPGAFIEIANSGGAAALKAIVGNGNGSTQTQQTIFMHCRKIADLTQHSLYGNWDADVGKTNSIFFIWLPYSDVLTDRVIFKWGTNFLLVTLPAAISPTIEYFWCFTIGPRGFEIWRDGILMGSSGTTAALTINYGGRLDHGPAVGEGWLGAKAVAIPPDPNYYSGSLSFKMLYTFERQLEWEEIGSYFNDPYGLIRPRPAPLSKLGPLNNRIEVTTPVVVVAEAQSPGASAVDTPELIAAEVVTEAQSPSASAIDSPELTTTEVVVEAQSPVASSIDSPELTPAEVQMDAQSPSLSAADVVVLALAEVLAEAQSPAADAVDALELTEAEVLMDAQSPTIDEVASVEPIPIEVAIEAQVPSVSAVDAVRLLPAVIEMDANALSADAIVSIVTKAAEVIFGMARFDISTEDDLFYTHKQAVHNALVAAINQGIFLPVTYDPATKLMSIPEDESEAIPPASLAANELTCLFGLPERNRRDRIMERNTWRWQAIVKFHREVVLELFEEAVLAEPILIAQDDTKSLRQITLHLIDADYIHPPKQSSSSGTQVTYTFEARLGPV
jgi:hypothetical protein